MPPSVEVSPSTSKNVENNNSNANDVMSALSLAMANALLEGNNNSSVPSNIESSVSSSDVPTTTSRASSNDGLSIWGSSTTSR